MERARLWHRYWAVLLGLVVPLLAQGMWDTLWTRTYGGNSYDYLLDGDTPGGPADPFYLVGYTGSLGAGNSDLWVLRVSAQDGSVFWERTYGGLDWDYGWDLTIADALVAVGFTRSFSVGWTDAWILRFDPATGDTLWTRTYGGFALDRAYGVHAAFDGYFVVGCTMSFGAGQYDLWILKLDPATGDTLWTRTYGGFANDCGYGLVSMDNALYAVGYTASFGQGNWDLWLLKVDPQTGDTLWTRTYGGWAEDFGEDLAVFEPLDGLFAVGWTGSFGAGGADLWILRFDPQTGDTLWTRTYGGIGNDRARGIGFTRRRTGMVVGETESFGAGGTDLWVLEFDPQTGETLRTRTYGGPAEDRAWGFMAGGSGGPDAVIGETRSWGQGDVDGWFLALAPGVAVSEGRKGVPQPLVRLTPEAGVLRIRYKGKGPLPAVLILYRSDGRRVLRCSLDLRPGLLTLPLALPAGLYRGELQTRSGLLWRGPLLLVR